MSCAQRALARKAVVRPSTAFGKFEVFSEEIMCLILSMLPPASRLQVSRVCWWWYRLTRDRLVWDRVVLREMKFAMDSHVVALANRVPIIRRLEIVRTCCLSCFSGSSMELNPFSQDARCCL